MFLVNAGLGTPRICMEDEICLKDDAKGVPVNRATTRFENKVGYLDVAGGGESMIRKRVLERFFVDVVAGDPLMKERAAVRFNDMIGSVNVVAGEPVLLNPQRFRQNLAWLELNKIWRMNTKVRGFIVERVRGGYAVAIGGFVCFLPNSRFRVRRRDTPIDRFTIESINPKKKSVVVF